MKITIKKRLQLCWEILTIKSGHAHCAQTKQLSTFIDGYAAGYRDGFIQARIKPSKEGKLNMEQVA